MTLLERKFWEVKLDDDDDERNRSNDSSNDNNNDVDEGRFILFLFFRCCYVDFLMITEHTVVLIVLKI